MKPTETGHLYDKIASWWDEQQSESLYGLHFVQKAIGLSTNKGKALDVGCGSGGRIITVLLKAGFQVTGIDVSAAMVELARKHHPGSVFIHDDICEWQPQEEYDIIIAWDSIFHAPYKAQGQVIRKLCGALTDGGVLLFTAGGIDSEITGEMCNQIFYYSSLAEEEYLRILKEMGCLCILLERDQYSEEHVVFIAIRNL
jgi:SAM-dependent methyltransferase